jgi:hypothetical protein
MSSPRVLIPMAALSARALGEPSWKRWHWNAGTPKALG